jgi:hypothetical protein
VANILETVLSNNSVPTIVKEAANIDNNIVAKGLRTFKVEGPSYFTKQINDVNKGQKTISGKER